MLRKPLFLNSLYPERRVFHHKAQYKHSLLCISHVQKLLSFPITCLSLSLLNSVSFQFCEYLHESLHS